jgi:hypothetical protein
MRSTKEVLKALRGKEVTMTIRAKVYAVYDHYTPDASLADDFEVVLEFYDPCLHRTLYAHIHSSMIVEVKA